MSWIRRKENLQTDEDLLASARTGDQEALADLFNRYVDLLFGVALKYYKDSEKAKDAVMEIYVKLQSKVQSHNIDSFKPWLYVLAKNHCLEELRRNQKINQQKEAYKFVQSNDVFHPYSEDLKETQLEVLENCLETLKKEQKELIQSFYLEQRSYKEISTQLSMPWEQVRSHIQNGRRNLKKCMDSSL